YASRYNSFYKLGFRPRTKVFISTSFLLPSALCPLPFFVTNYAQLLINIKNPVLMTGLLSGNNGAIFPEG
ncbi:MAG: hypothetical protein ACYT04_000000102420, partial [Nostoc sp.]